LRSSIRSLAAAAALAALAAPCAAESLRFSDPGIYGTAWVPYALDNPDHFDFLIYQARLHKAGAASIPEALKALSDAGLRLVVDMQFYTERAQRGIRDEAPPMRETDYYVDLFAAVLDRVAAMPIDALTIEEENVYWGGRAEFLGEMYRRLKQRYPQRSFYQWYSPRRKPSIAIPGKTWPDLPSDGWVVDQYGIYGEEFEEYIGQMKALNKPLIAVVWASPQWKVGDKSKTHDQEWWDKQGWKMLYSHLATYRKHDVPVTFFMFTTEEGESEQTIPLYQSKDQCDQKFLEAFVRNTLPMIRSGQRIQLRIPERRPAWIPGHCG
jgi:hypothetical protein